MSLNSLKKSTSTNKTANFCFCSLAAAYEQNHGNAEARFGAENTAAGESFESAAEAVDGSDSEREGSDVAANETASESQNEPEANESADTVSEEPEEEILEEWKD